MTSFIHLMTIDNNRIHIDPDTIVSFSEFKYRENDIGLVGTSIVYCIGSVPTSISVRDPIDYVADQIFCALRDNSPEGLPDSLLPQLQGKTIQTSESPDWTNFATLKTLYDPEASTKKFSEDDYVIYSVDGQVYQVLRVLRDNCYEVQTRPDCSNQTRQVHADYLRKCEPYRKRTPPANELHPSPLPRKHEPEEASNKKFEPVINLRVRSTPQETPPCNGNGEAQSKEG